MATIPCHIVVEDNPAIIYASRNGSPAKVLPILNRFLEKFWQERDISGEYSDTPECLVAQIVVRFGFEICEDDFSNLRIGLSFKPDVEYLYQVLLDQTVRVWVPTDTYSQDPNSGLAACQEWTGDGQLYSGLSIQGNSI
ncbi:histidine kinase [Cyanobacteria bacterium FACHB-471]|nr:histidine kinase [Cyanobacteria bacterium FACHB-471]